MENIKGFIKDTLSFAALWGVLDLIAFVFVQLTIGGAVLETAKWCLLCYAFIMDVVLISAALKYFLGDRDSCENNKK